jgi:arginine:agmatine antiporter
MSLSGGERKLGAFLATMLVASNMIGSSIYLLPASAGAIGSVSLLGWVAAIAGVAVLGVVFSWLAILRPNAGGLIANIGEGLGSGTAFVGAFIYWVSCWAGNVAIALAVTGYLSVFFPIVAKPPGTTIATIAVMWLLVAANWAGPRFVTRLQGWTLLIGLAPILLVALGGWFFFNPAIFAASWNVTGEPLSTVLPRTVVPAMWGFLGVESAIVVAPLLRDPRRDIPIATLGGVALSGVIYVLALAAIMGLIPAAALARSDAPFADATRAMVGASIGGAVAVFAILKTSGALGGWVLVSAETGAALVSEGAPRAGPPSTVNLLVTGALMTLAALLSASPSIGRQFAVLIDVSVVLTLIVYALGCLTLVRLSGAFGASGGLRRRPGVAALGAVGCVLCLLAIAASERRLLVWSVGVAGVAIAVRLGLRARRRLRLKP